MHGVKDSLPYTEIVFDYHVLWCSLFQDTGEPQASQARLIWTTSYLHPPSSLPEALAFVLSVAANIPGLGQVKGPEVRSGGVGTCLIIILGVPFHGHRSVLLACAFTLGFATHAAVLLCATPGMLESGGLVNRS